jgi:UDP-N-acetylmuramoyl-tripeptide--D-alanyl-D-alanine ligase
VIDRSAGWIAEAAGAELLAGDPEAPGPRRAVIDSREVEPGDLFVGLRGATADGGAFAAQAEASGAWGVLVSREWAEPTAAEPAQERAASPPAVIAADDPLAALQRLSREWRRELGCPAIGVTGSTGKTSTKDILAALLRPHMSAHAKRENLNTEIGLPLSLLEAGRDTEVLVLEMAMRGEGQIAELVSIAEPNVGVIVNVGPVHLELLGTVERVAAAKAELIRDLQPGSACVVPAGERLLADHLRDDLTTITFGPGGDVQLRSFDPENGQAIVDAAGQPLALELPFREPHNLVNTLAAVAACRALGVTPAGHVEVRFSSMRGQEVELPGGITVVNDCYNANPMSMRAALDHLAAAPAERRIAVLGYMAELGPEERRFHREVGERADELGVDVLVTVGEQALPYAEGFRDGETYSVGSPEEAGGLLDEIAAEGDRVLIKGSRSAGLERVLGEPAATGGSPSH